LTPKVNIADAQPIFLSSLLTAPTGAVGETIQVPGQGGGRRCRAPGVAPSSLAVIPAEHQRSSAVVNGRWTRRCDGAVF
jgi:hypothetical protein